MQYLLITGTIVSEHSLEILLKNLGESSIFWKFLDE